VICRLIRFQALFHTCLFILACLSWHEEIDAASLQTGDNSQNEDGFDIERKVVPRRLTSQPWMLIKVIYSNIKWHNLLLRVRAFSEAGGSPYQ
jgi:hypothetical protein